jgi:hypothetical protein
MWPVLGKMEDLHSAKGGEGSVSNIWINLEELSVFDGSNMAGTLMIILGNTFWGIKTKWTEHCLFLHGDLDGWWCKHALLGGQLAQWHITKDACTQPVQASAM